MVLIEETVYQIASARVSIKPPLVSSNPTTMIGARLVVLIFEHATNARSSCGPKGNAQPCSREDSRLASTKARPGESPERDQILIRQGFDECDDQLVIGVVVLKDFVK